MINNQLSNATLPVLFERFTQWHYDRNLIDGTTSQVQFKKLLEETIELYMSLHPGITPDVATMQIIQMTLSLNSAGRIKTCDGSGLPDAIGDINVVLDNIAEREGYTMASCLSSAYDDIKDRKGQMINGTFVKESDL